MLELDATRRGGGSRAARFNMGTSRSPGGDEITADGVSLRRNGKPWLAVMGEFHFSRYPAGEWRAELEKMKAGGIDIAATYVFWIHHEEIEGEIDFTGRRSLRDFVAACGEVGLYVVVRCGPWCHGEVRNGGLPDWILPLGKRLRTDDAQYMAKVQTWYSQISAQLRGLLFKDGGPVIGVQVENEYWGPPPHLLNLKSMAREVGLDVPLYTRTGWPQLPAPIAFGELLPLHGAYAEGFWDRDITPMPGKYWQSFVFEPPHADTAIGTDQLGHRDVAVENDAATYPYFTCELGGGMTCSYHRRIRIAPADVVSVALVKLGSGGNLIGYYMYHGGTNPPGKRSTLHESQATKYPNDLPVMSYDFQAPLGEFGQIRPHYDVLRRLHSFVRDFGEKLAPMHAYFPQQRPSGGDDTSTLRWAVRTDGSSGFVFVNNYQRLQSMPAKTGVQFHVRLPTQTLRIPHEPVTVPADSYFFWPFNLDIGGVRLRYATAQPVRMFEEDGVLHVTFAQIAGVPCEFVIDASSAMVESATGRVQVEGGQVRVTPRSGGEVAYLRSSDGRRVCISLEREESRGEMAVAGVQVEPVKPAGSIRQIKMGSRGVAEAPTDADFDHAAVWRVKLPRDIDPGRDLLLRVHYVGDVARIYLDGELLTDNFYNGSAFEIGLRRYAPAIARGELLLKILPLQKGAPIYLSADAWPEFGDTTGVAKVLGVELVEQAEPK